MPAYHPCNEPLRLEPKTFFIRGPFIRGGLLMAHVFFLTFASLALAAAEAKLNGVGSVLRGWWWRVPLETVTPLAHFIFLKQFVEGRRPHFMDDRVRWALRKRISFLRPWPERFPLFPRLVPEAEIVLRVLRAPTRAGQAPRFHNPEPVYSSHPMLRLE